MDFLDHQPRASGIAIVKNIVLFSLPLMAVLAVFGMIFYPWNGNIVAVVQIIRHGERTPIKFYTKDPFISKIYWEGLGMGQLTKNGKRQHYALGKFIRKHYGDFIPETYAENFIIAQSTSTPRSHMSTQCTLYGLFSANDGHDWLENQDWQSFPVYDVDRRILYNYPFFCRSYSLEFKKYYYSKEYLEMNQKYSQVYQYMSHHSGDNINDTYTAYDLYDTLFIEDTVGLNLPDWTKEVYPEPLRSITAFNFQHTAPTVKYQRIFMGAFINETITFFDNVIGEKTSLKYLMFGAHDSNLIALLQIFGAYDSSRIPWFTSSLWIELRRAFGNYYLNVWYKNKDNFQRIAIEECNGYNCPFDTFKVHFKDVLSSVDDFEAECGSEIFTAKFLFVINST